VMQKGAVGRLSRLVAAGIVTFTTERPGRFNHIMTTGLGRIISKGIRQPYQIHTQTSNRDARQYVTRSPPNYSFTPDRKNI
jgi:hypothetical protein